MSIFVNDLFVIIVLIIEYIIFIFRVFYNGELW